MSELVEGFLNSMGTLYIVGTPIGNLQDISLRAVKVLRDVKLIACEDTRRTGQLLQSLRSMFDLPDDPRPQLLSYYEEIEQRRIPEIIELLQKDWDIALVSDAGMPAVSDPGFRLVRECIANHIKVETIPGPSSVLTALVVSGMPTDKFTFLGYPPHKPGHRKTLFESVKASRALVKTTTILFEAPHKVLKTLEELEEVFGDIEIALCRELTKIHEEVRREKLSEARKHFRKTVPKGEFVIVF